MSTIALSQRQPVNIVLMKDQIIDIDLPLGGHKLCPGYISGQSGLPMEIYLRLYVINDIDALQLNNPEELSGFVSEINDEHSAWRFLRLFTALNTHYYFQKADYTIDLGVAETGSLLQSVILTPDAAKRAGYEPPRMIIEDDGYTASRDLIHADPAAVLSPATVIRRRESISGNAGYRFIEDSVKGEIGREHVAFPAYE